MYTLMYLQTSFLKCFIAHITAIWTLPSMYTLMYLQNTCVPECFMTHTAAKWTLPSMYMMMSLQATCIAECFIAHISNMDAPQYVHDDVSSRYLYR